jgi:hypothetical protein
MHVKQIQSMDTAKIIENAIIEYEKVFLAIPASKT